MRYYLVVVLCHVVQSVHAHKKDQVIRKKKRFRFSAVCGVLNTELVHVPSLRGSVSEGCFNVECEAEQKTNSKRSHQVQQNSTFHEHQSFKTSSSIHLLFHPSMTSVVLCFCTHAHTATVEVLGQWVNLVFVKTIYEVGRWWKAVRCLHLYMVY